MKQRHIFDDTPISCVVNPFNSTEEKYIANKTETPKYAVVAGGGPGGLQAAWILAARGHKVDLIEKESYFGGAFLPASYPPSKSPIAKMIGYYIRQWFDWRRNCGFPCRAKKKKKFMDIR